MDHAEGGAVLDRAAGVEPFGFRGEFDIGEFGTDAGEPEQRRVADAIDQGFAVVVRGWRDRRFGGGWIHGKSRERGWALAFFAKNLIIKGFYYGISQGCDSRGVTGYWGRVDVWRRVPEGDSSLSIHDLRSITHK